MIEANNPDIDVVALRLRMLSEMQQPEQINIPLAPVLECDQGGADMIETNNPDVDVVALERRVLNEIRQPEQMNIPALPALDVSVAHAMPDVALSGFKHRLRSIPVLGTLLSAMNSGRRRMQRGVLAIPYLGYGLRWLKSLALVHETRNIVMIVTRELAYLEQRLHTEMSNAELRLHTEMSNAELRLHAEMSNAELRLKAVLELHEARLIAMRQEVAHEKQLMAGNRGEIQFLQRRIAIALDTRGLKPPAPADSVDATTVAIVPKDALDSYYAAFEAAFRGSREEIKNRQKVYLDRVAACATGKPILDIGCGRGEWIELLHERGITAYGIDMNSVFVADAHARKLDIHEAEALTHLRSLEDASLTGITAFHVIEHLELKNLINILDEAKRVLAPGGFLLFETPNPENLIVGASTFWSDPTHRAPLPPPVSRFMVEQRGFAGAEIIYLHPADAALHLEGADASTQRLNQLLYGARDYAIWAHKV